MVEGLPDHVIASDGLDLDIEAKILAEVIHGDLVVAQVEELVIFIDDLEAIGIPCFSQQFFCRFGVIAIVLLDLLGPLLERDHVPGHLGASGPLRAGIAPTLHVVLSDGLKVDGHVDGSAHPDVVKGGGLVVPMDRRFRTIGKRVEHQVRFGLLQIDRSNIEQWKNARSNAGMMKKDSWGSGIAYRFF